MRYQEFYCILWFLLFSILFERLCFFFTLKFKYYLQISIKQFHCRTETAQTQNKTIRQNIVDVGERRVFGSGPMRASTIFYKSGCHQHAAISHNLVRHYAMRAWLLGARVCVYGCVSVCGVVCNGWRSPSTDGPVYTFPSTGETLGPNGLNWLSHPCLSSSMPN